MLKKFFIFSLVLIMTLMCSCASTEAPQTTEAPQITEAPQATATPTEIPTQEPTQTPTQEPTQTPTQEPTQTPTQAPTQEPTQKPTTEPTQAPTHAPTQTPTQEPEQEKVLVALDKPRIFMSTKHDTGKAEQGFAVYGNYAFMMYHTGICNVYDLETRDSEPIASFRLGSYNTGTPDKRYANHANQAMFLGTEPAPGSDFPYLMVTTGHSAEKDSEGYIARASIEKINRDFTCETVHTFIFTDKDMADYSYGPIGWGWPAFSMDVEEKVIYLLSAEHRTIHSEFEKYGENTYIITKVAIPESISGNKTILSFKDVVDQYEVEFDIFFTQGGMFHDGLLYHSFGCYEEYPAGIRVFDPVKRDWIYKIDLGDTVVGRQEIEAISYYNDMLLCNTDRGIIYVIAEMQ